MALEKSVLDAGKIGDILSSRYGLHMRDVEHVPFGSANCYKAVCEEGDYFVKEFQSEIDPEAVKREADIVSYLCSKGFPAVKFVSTEEGQHLITVDGHVVCVQDYVEGKTYMNDLPHPLLMEGAKYLGILHSLLKDYPMEKDMDEKWIEVRKSDRIRRKFDPLIEAAQTNKDDPACKRICEDLEYKRDLIERISGYGSYFDGITYTPSHGDYTACQFICGDDGIKAVIDFAAAACLPACWEIMRSYVQSSGACSDGEPFDAEDFALYVSEYAKYSPLTVKDIEAMPYVYLFQLAGSSYGYKEYLITGTQNRDDLLKFALWRTDVCREIATRAEEISQKLLKTVKT